ncbi:hypothetical protein OPQ81_002617 [Rhizoctonia solani]|nr:hypothetical protein OPQ81_002617 [Rhizoctonia solani]
MPQVNVQPPEQLPQSAARRNHTNPDEEDIKKFVKIFRDAQHCDLPKAGLKEAPETWDGQANKLNAFFWDMEDLFDNYIIDDKDKVKVLIKYIKMVPEGMI